VKRLLALLRRSAQTITLPLFDGLSLYDVAIFFWKGIYEGAVTSRAASISFSFFLALFPGVIFVFTLIPFIPIDGFQHELFRLLRDVLPPNSFDAAYSTITDILTIKRGDLLGITVAAALFFATNGTLALIGNFGQTIHRLNVRGFWSQYLAAFWLTLALALLLIGGIAVLALGEVWIPTLIQWYLADRLGPLGGAPWTRALCDLAAVLLRPDALCSLAIYFARSLARHRPRMADLVPVRNLRNGFQPLQPILWLDRHPHDYSALDLRERHRTHHWVRTQRVDGSGKKPRRGHQFLVQAPNGPHCTHQLDFEVGKLLVVCRVRYEHITFCCERFMHRL
jgi:hypothetical protein